MRAIARVVLTAVCCNDHFMTSSDQPSSAADHAERPTEHSPAPVNAAQDPATSDDWAAHESEKVEAGKYRGLHFSKWDDELTKLRAAERTDELLELLDELMAAAEREAEYQHGTIDPRHHKLAAEIHRERGDVAGEIAVLDRYSAVCNGEDGPTPDDWSVARRAEAESLQRD